MNRRSIVATLGAPFLAPMLRVVVAQEQGSDEKLTDDQRETFSGAEGIVYRRLDVEVSGRPYAWENTEQHAQLDWYALVYPDEATAKATFEAWDERIGRFGDPPATWLFPDIDEYDDPSQTFIARPIAKDDLVQPGNFYLYSEWDPALDGAAVGHIFTAYRGRVLVAALVTNAEGYEDVHLAMTTGVLSRMFLAHVLLDTPLPAPGEVIDEARSLTLAPPPELIADEEDIDGCTEVETWTRAF